MSTYAELTEKATTQLLEAVKPVEELAVTVASAVDGAVRKLPSLPVSERFPTPAQVVGANFAILGRLMTAQQDFAQRLLDPAGVPARATAASKATASSKV
ncbi:MAG: hypothetical protein JWN87_107 [Frankiales bacterium]|jgi:hypothetical protein|nr:hypothetical protein [Frankiales bacterium]